MMKQARLALAALALTAAGAAHAEFSATPALVSDYNWRGTSQSAQDPALQLALDWNGNGLHFGFWGSTTDFGRNQPDVEVDALVDYSFGEKGGVQYNVGAVYYGYPGYSQFAFPEVSFKASKDWWSASIAYSWDYFHASESAWYATLGATLPIAKSGYNLNLHYGYNFGDFFDSTGAGGSNGFKAYADYSVAVSRTIDHFNVSLGWFGNDNLKVPGHFASNDDEAILQISTTLPWAR